VSTPLKPGRPTRARRTSTPSTSAAALVVALVLFAGACSGGNKEPVEAAQPGETTATTEQATCNSAAVEAEPHHVATAKSTRSSIDIYDAANGTPTETLDVPRLTDTNPPVEVPLVFLVVQQPEDDCSWMEVYLPTRPNFSTGWVKRSDVDVTGHDNRIEVSLGGFNLKFFKGDELVMDVPIAVATEDTPTPGGTYYTTELLKPPDPDGVYGPYAFGLSGHSDTLTTYNGGEGQLGIHGTNTPEKIGSQVSHGCIRMLNEDITNLAEGVDTVYGIPVQVNP
jgi:lipoprotein-anchoring transpeptidase ErfK/SrfK